MRKRMIYAVLGLLVAIMWWASGDAPVSRTTGNWAARGSTPEETAALFTSPMTESPRIDLVGLGETTAKVRVFQTFRGDDSVDSIEYTVRVIRVGSVWQVESATYNLACKRGWSFRGSPCA